jgi:hypothetical protein
VVERASLSQLVVGSMAITLDIRCHCHKTSPGSELPSLFSVHASASLLPEADEHPRLLCAARRQVGRHDDIAIRADATGVYIATRVGKCQFAG